jgi:uncharacterized protein (TIGR03663 family)
MGNQNKGQVTDKQNGTESTPETCQTTPDWTAYFTTIQWLLFCGALVLGLIMRWTMLDMRPYHHDESLHGMYGRYFYDFPNANFYKYDPMLHGPMLYNSMRFIYAMFGDSLWAARTPVCIMGSLFMLVPFLYRRFLLPSTTLVLTAAVALSPTMVYWSRFLREDYWVMSGMLFTLFGFTIAPRAWKALFVFLGIVIQWCTKENFFVSLAVFTGFCVFESFFKDLIAGSSRSMRDFIFRGLRICGLAGFCFLLTRLPDQYLQPKVATIMGLIFTWLIFESIFEYVVIQRKDTAFGAIGRHLQESPLLSLVSFVAAAVVFCWFYGAGFRYPKGILDGLGDKAIDYWAKHHAMERIKGPFNFHVYVTAWYELPVFVALLTHMALFYKRALPQIRFGAALVCLAIFFSWIATPSQGIESMAAWKPFKLKNHLDIVGLFILLFHAPLVTIQHMLKGERVLATAGYFFAATFFVYSYLGEKVPWLSVYPLAFSLPYLGLFFQDYFKRYPFNYKEYSVSNAFLWIGSTSIVFGLIFVAEQWSEPNERFSRENLAFIVFGMLAIVAALVAQVDAAKRNTSTTFFGTMNIGRWAVVITCLFMIRASVQTNFLYAGKETEYLSQVHTTYELAEFAKNIIDQATFERNGFRPRVYATGESTWPLTWYFRNIPNEYRFSLKSPDEIKEFAYIFLSWKEKHDPSEIPEGYIQRRVNLRGWWVPDFNQISFKKFLRYSINHYPWNTSGFSYATMLTAKDMERFRK